MQLERDHSSGRSPYFENWLLTRTISNNILFSPFLVPYFVRHPFTTFPLFSPPSPLYSSCEVYSYNCYESPFDITYDLFKWKFISRPIMSNASIRHFIKWSNTLMTRTSEKYGTATSTRRDIQSSIFDHHFSTPVL